MNDESADISSKTWNRSVEAVCKAGFMDGADNGQTATFQSSFNKGYGQGFKFGYQLGINESLLSNGSLNNPDEVLKDPRKINCQLCLNEALMQEKLENLINIQEEKNAGYLLTIKQ